MSVGGRGLKDWVIQRITAVFLGAYFLFILGFIFLHPNLDFSQWYLLFQKGSVQLATLIAILSLAFHAWIGLWTITTDYVHATGIKLAVLSVVGIAILLFVVWGVLILWQ